jgi:hypothetical protein
LAQQPHAGRVHVADPSEGVGQDDGIRHRMDYQLPRDGGQVDQPLPEQAPHQDAAGGDKGERGQVDPRERADREVVQQVGAPGQQCRRDQDQRSQPVDPREPRHAQHEHRGSREHQDVRVEEMDPEERSGAHERQLMADRVALVVAHQVMGGGDREQQQDGRGLDG